MGNSPISIVLRTEKQTYKAGDCVNGTVYVSINKQAQSAQSITLRIQGREHSLVHYTTSETRREGGQEHTHDRDVYDESSNDFLQAEYPLHNFPAQQLLPGQYEFPFSITLPTNLPSSMYCQQGRSHCSVEYRLISTLVKPSSGIFTSHPNSEQKLTIWAAPPPGEQLQDTSLLLPMDEIPVNSCCCNNRGIVVLQAQVGRTTVQPKDNIDVRFRCQNQSTVRVKKVRVQLEQITEWNTSHGRSEVVKRVLDRREMDGTHFPELDKQRRKRRSRAEYFGAAPDQEPFRDGSDQWKLVAIRVPDMVRDSYCGTAVKVRHLVSVQLLTKGCCTTDPDATTSVQVYQSLPDRPLSSAGGVQPSAPSSMYDEFANNADLSNYPATPSAPPSQYDAYTTAALTPWNDTNMGASAPMEVYDDNVMATPVAEAQMLPPDWNAQTAETVTIPMAEAVVLEDHSPPSPWKTTSTK